VHPSTQRPFRLVPLLRRLFGLILPARRSPNRQTWPPRVDHLLKDALALPPDDRERLAAKILAACLASRRLLRAGSLTLRDEGSVFGVQTLRRRLSGDATNGVSRAGAPHS
jgi:hypothetical protein